MTTVLQDNNNYILHLDIQDETNNENENVINENENVINENENEINDKSTIGMEETTFVFDNYSNKLDKRKL